MGSVVSAKDVLEDAWPASPLFALGLRVDVSKNTGLGPMLLRADSGYPKPMVPDVAMSSSARLQSDPKALLSRSILEKQRLSERLCAAQEWDAALDAFHAVAEMASDIGDQKVEGWAVRGMAHCLAQREDVDDELVLGMYAHSRDCASNASDVETQFLALTGIATLQRLLRRKEAAVKAWDVALDFARAECEPDKVAYACTQAALLLLESPDSSTIDMVNEDKQHVNEVNEAPSLEVGPSLSTTRAVRLLNEALVELSKTDHQPKQAAIASMNLARALLKLGGAANKRKAAQQMLEAFAKLRACSNAPDLQLAVACQILQLHEQSPWLHDVLETAMDACLSMVSRSEEAKPALGVPCDPEDRYAYEKAMWAQKKLAKMTSEQTDSEDDVGPAYPKGEDWRR